MITCQTVASVHDLFSSTKRIAKWSNFIKQGKNQLRGKLVTLSRKLLLMLICYLSNIPTHYKYAYHFASTWSKWQERGEMTVRRLDSVPSLVPSWMPFYFFQLAQPHPVKCLLIFPDSFFPDLTFPYNSLLTLPHPWINPILLCASVSLIHKDRITTPFTKCLWMKSTVRDC